jgi:hypothetical protein
MGYFARRTHDPQAAADLTSETFASAIVAQRRFRRDGAPCDGVAVRDRGSAPGRLSASRLG